MYNHVKRIIIERKELKMQNNLQELSKEELKSIFNRLDVGILIHNGEKPLYANEAMLEILGAKSFDEIRDKNLVDLMFAEYVEIYRTRVRRVFKTGKVPKCTEKITNLNGNKKWIEVSANAVFFNGAPSILAIVTDVTTRVKNENRLSKMYKLELIEDIADGILKGSESLEEIGEKIYNYCKKSGIANYTYFASVQKDKIVLRYGYLGNGVLRNQNISRNEKTLLCYIADTKNEVYLPNVFDFEVDGYKTKSIAEDFPYEQLSYFAIPVKHKEDVVAIVAFLKKGYDSFSKEDLTLFKITANQIAVAFNLKEMALKLQKEKERYRTLATYDTLTNVYTRHFFNEWIEKYYETVKRKNKFCSLVMIDVDNFKHINDSYGHLTGDKVLSSVALVLKESVRRMDLVVRYGGDEFLLVFPETPEKIVKGIMQRVEKNLESLKSTLGFKVSISYGTSYITPEIGYAKALEIADDRMYTIKNSKKT